jgi:chromosome segregation ATPase
VRSLVPLAALALLVAALLGARGQREAIARARAEAARLAGQRDSLLTAVERREQEQAALALERDSVRALADGLRDSVAMLERRREEAQLTVRQLRTTGALMSRLRATFPELSDSARCPPGSPRRS